MTIEIQAEINKRLHERLLGLTGTAPDYIGSEVALAPVISRLNTRAWTLQGFDAVGNPADWRSAERIRLRRVRQIVITRSPEHQAAAEAAGEVQPGDNTYPRIVTEDILGRFGQQFLVTETAKGEPLDTRRAVLGVMAIRAAGRA